MRELFKMMKSPALFFLAMFFACLLVRSLLLIGFLW